MNWPIGVKFPDAGYQLSVCTGSGTSLSIGSPIETCWIKTGISVLTEFIPRVALAKDKTHMSWR